LNSDRLRIHDFRKILLIKLSAVGDVVNTIPVLNKLRRRYPAAQIDWLVKPGIGELIRYHPAISNLRAFGEFDPAQPASLRSEVSRFFKLASELRAARYDLVVDLQGQLRSAILALATASPVRIGFDRPRRELWRALDRQLPSEAYKHCWRGAREGSWLAYTHRIGLTTLDMHPVDRYLLLSPMLGLDNDPVDFSFPIPEATTQRVGNLLASHSIDRSAAPLVVMAPGTVWETKHWTTEGFAEVARHFLRRGWRVALTGARSEQAICAEVARAAPGATDLSGRTTLSELAALIRRSAICLANDSGPMHLAVALGRPVVSVFGPTDTIWAGPYQRPHAAVLAGLACSPCYLRRLDQCPYDHACMQKIAPAAVIAQMEKSLMPARLDSPASRLTAAG
jgi:predicted lipopolysaccharide heptosyltransferase III